jgi:creatinine amidohydrolase/Fe(II)-dependent formamide hydrolase-like protein
MRLEEMRPAQIRAAAESGVPVVLPVGVIEAHGHHLPVGTDAIAATDCALRAAEQLPLVVAPTLWYGPSTYDVGAPEMGSMEVPFPVFAPYVEAVLRSLVRLGFKHIFVLIQHQGPGGEEGLACAAAAQRLWSETGRGQLGEGWWGRLTPEQQAEARPGPTIHLVTTVEGTQGTDKPIGGDHAGYWETSFIYGFRPHLVDLEELRRPDRPWYASRTKPAVEDATLAEGADTARRMVEGFVRVVCARTGRPLPAPGHRQT